MNAKTDKFPIGVMIALLCYCFGFQAITVNTVGLFFAPASQAIGVSRGTFSTYYSVQSVVTMITLFFAGKFMQKHHKKIKLILLASTALIFIGYTLYAIGSSMWFWYVGAVLVGVAVAFTTQMFIGSIVINWFKIKAGAVMGVLMAVTSVYGVFISPVFTGLIQSKGYQFVYWLINIMMVVSTTLPTIFLIYFKPADAGRKAYGEDEVASSQTHSASSVGSQAPKNVAYQKAIKSPAFWLIFVFTFAAVCWSGFVQILPGFAQAAGFEGAMIGTAISVMMVGGIIGKFGLGFMNDKMGPVKSTLIMVVLGVIGAFLMIANSSASQTWFFGGTFLFGLAYGILGVVPPIIVKDAFGMKNYSAIYGNITIAIWIATATSIPFFNYIFDITGSYNIPMYITISIFIIGFICMVLGRNSAKKLPREE